MDTGLSKGFQAPLRLDGRVDSTVFDIRQEPDDEMVRNRLLKSRHGVFSDVSAESGADDPVWYGRSRRRLQQRR